MKCTNMILIKAEAEEWAWGMVKAGAMASGEGLAEATAERMAM